MAVLPLVPNRPRQNAPKVIGQKAQAGYHARECFCMSAGAVVEDLSGDIEDQQGTIREKLQYHCAQRSQAISRAPSRRP